MKYLFKKRCFIYISFVCLSIEFFCWHITLLIEKTEIISLLYKNKNFSIKHALKKLYIILMHLINMKEVFKNDISEIKLKKRSS